MIPALRRRKCFLESGFYEIAFRENSTDASEDVQYRVHFC